MSKRHGASAVTQYRDEGYLPEAMVNYLARLGWSHGDDEIFTREQFVAVVRPGRTWARAPAQCDAAKLRWVNAQHMKAGRRCAPGRAGAEAAAAPRRRRRRTMRRWPRSARCSRTAAHTIVELADWLAHVLRATSTPSADDVATHVTDAVRPALAALREAAPRSRGSKARSPQAIKEMLARARPEDAAAGACRCACWCCGRAQTPSLDAVLRTVRPRRPCSRACERLEGGYILMVFAAMAHPNRIARHLRPGRGYSSAGRALAWHARGQRFDPAYLHQQSGKSQLTEVVKVLSPHRLEA